MFSKLPLLISWVHESLGILKDGEGSLREELADACSWVSWQSGIDKASTLKIAAGTHDLMLGLLEEGRAALAPALDPRNPRAAACIAFVVGARSACARQKWDRLKEKVVKDKRADTTTRRDDRVADGGRAQALLPRSRRCPHPIVGRSSSAPTRIPSLGARSLNNHKNLSPASRRLIRDSTFVIDVTTFF